MGILLQNLWLIPVIMAVVFGLGVLFYFILFKGSTQKNGDDSSKLKKQIIAYSLILFVLLISFTFELLYYIQSRQLLDMIMVAGSALLIVLDSVYLSTLVKKLRPKK